MATSRANDILKVLADTAHGLRAFQGIDSNVYVLLKPDQASPEQLMQLMQVVNGGKSVHRILPGHEKDVVCMEDLLASIKTYATQAVKRDVACTQLGEEAAAKTRC